jgi:hypothetical protein
VAFRGRHTRSHPQLPLATPETDPKAVLRKGKASEEEASITEPGNPPYPSVGAPFSPPQLFDQYVSAVSRFLNFGSVPIEFPSPGPGPEGQDFVTPPPLKLYLGVYPRPQKISPLLHKEENMPTGAQ